MPFRIQSMYKLGHTMRYDNVRFALKPTGGTDARCKYKLKESRLIGENNAATSSERHYTQR